MGHTPGKWAIGHVERVKRGGVYYAFTQISSDAGERGPDTCAHPLICLIPHRADNGSLPPEREANARAIAAVPMLIAACEAALAEIAADNRGGGEGYGTMDTEELLRAALAAARTD